MSNIRECIIKITPDNETHKVNVTTGSITNLEIVDYLAGLQKHFAKAICEEYTDLTGDKDIKEEDFDKYVEFLRKNKL